MNNSQLRAIFYGPQQDPGVFLVAPSESEKELTPVEVTEKTRVYLTDLLRRLDGMPAQILNLNWDEVTNNIDQAIIESELKDMSNVVEDYLSRFIQEFQEKVDKLIIRMPHQD